MTGLDREDDELKALERRMRAKLFACEPTSRLTEEERRMAEKLIGWSNAERLQRHNGGRGKFRPTPVRVHYEYYFIPPDDCYWHPREGRWKIVRVENGRTLDHQWTHDTFEAEIAHLRSKGATLREFRVGPQTPQKQAPKVSKRKELLEKIGRLRA